MQAHNYRGEIRINLCPRIAPVRCDAVNLFFLGTFSDGPQRDILALLRAARDQINGIHGAGAGAENGWRGWLSVLALVD